MPSGKRCVFTAGALIGVATGRLQRGCPRTPAEMAALTWPLISALHHLDTGSGAQPRPV